MHENDDMHEKLPSKAEIGGFVVKQLLQITKFYEEVGFAQPNKFKSNVEKNVPVIAVFIINIRPQNIIGNPNGIRNNF